MDTIKIFTNRESITRALFTMMNYSFDERPLMKLIFTDEHLNLNNENAIKGMIEYMNMVDSRETITIKTPQGNRLEMFRDSIEELVIYDIEGE